MSRQSNSTTDFLSRTPRKGSPREKALRACITDERLATYNYEAQRRSCPALELYLWDHDMASACMGDIAILEVALRNRMDRQLSLLALEQNGTEDWYMQGCNSMTEPSTRFVKRGTISPRTSEKIIRMAIS